MKRLLEIKVIESGEEEYGFKREVINGKFTYNPTLDEGETIFKVCLPLEGSKDIRNTLDYWIKALEDQIVSF